MYRGASRLGRVVYATAEDLGFDGFEISLARGNKTAMKNVPY